MRYILGLYIHTPSCYIKFTGKLCKYMRRAHWSRPNEQMFDVLKPNGQLAETVPASKASG